MPWVRISFLSFSAAAGELFYLLLAVLVGREAWPAAPCWHWGSPTVWGDENGSSKKCSGLLTRCGQGQNRTGLGLQTLNGVKLPTAAAEMIAPLVVQGNCCRLGLKGSELLTAAGRRECLAVRGYL